jgi:uncharacterized membrane protein YqhA
MEEPSPRHRTIPPAAAAEAGLTTVPPKQASQPSGEGQSRRLRRAVSLSRFLLALVSVTLIGLSLMTSFWGIAKTVALAHALVWEDAWRETTALAKVVSILDVFLVATTIFVVGVGVWQLFITDLELPTWLEFEELRALKVVVADLLVLTVTVKLVEDFLLDGAGASFLREAVAVAIVNLTLIAFATLRSRRA